MRSIRFAILVLSVAFALSGCSRETPAEAIFVGGRIYTLAGEPPARVENEPFVEAIAVRGGRVVAAGSRAEIQRFAGDATRVHDLQGGFAFPGFVDSHVHLLGLGASLRVVDLTGTSSYDEVIERVRASAAETPAGTWITGRGWDQNDWPVKDFPDHAALSAATPDHSVWLRRIDGHAGLANARALAAAGIGPDTPAPAGGRIERRPDGTPAGVLVDGAMALVTRGIPAPSDAERRRRLQLALEHCAATGLTGVHDAGVSTEDAVLMRSLLAAGELPIRVYAMWDGTPDPDDPVGSDAGIAAGPQPFDPSQHLAFRCVKLMVDGALGSRGAALLAPYADAPDQHGLPRYTSEEFFALVRPLHAAGFQIATHAIGDAGNRLVLDAYERVQREMPRDPPPRHRIEHAQVLALEDIPRFAALGVLPSMQPTHCTSDMPWAPDRLGPDRLRGAYAWRALRATGVRIPAGSDAPVESVAPLLGLYAAITRQAPNGEPAGGWSPEERLDRSEALRAFTVWGAYASGTEADLGTLELGKRADLVVLDRDLFQVPPAELLATQVRLTAVDGVPVYEATGAQSAR